MRNRTNNKQRYPVFIDEDTKEWLMKRPENSNGKAESVSEAIRNTLMDLKENTLAELKGRLE